MKQIETVDDIQNEIATILAKEIQKEMDESIMVDMLVELGWTKVSFGDIGNNHKLVEILEWCNNTLTNNWKHLSGCFVFSEQKEAEWFILRWK